MARRGRGDGSIYFDAARGCWVGAIDLGRNPQTGGRVRRKVSAPTKDECKGKLAELRDEHRRTGTVARRDTTVEQIVADWLANPPEVRSPSHGAATGTRAPGSSRRSAPSRWLRSARARWSGC